MFIVLATLVVTSIISKGPIVFLKLAQDSVGEIDAFITPAGMTSNLPYYSEYFLNYTAINHALEAQ